MLADTQEGRTTSLCMPPWAFFGFYNLILGALHSLLVLPSRASTNFLGALPSRPRHPRRQDKKSTYAFSACLLGLLQTSWVSYIAFLSWLLGQMAHEDFLSCLLGRLHMSTSWVPSAFFAWCRLVVLPSWASTIFFGLLVLPSWAESTWRLLVLPSWVSANFLV